MIVWCLGYKPYGNHNSALTPHPIVKLPWGPGPSVSNCKAANALRYKALVASWLTRRWNELGLLASSVGQMGKNYVKHEAWLAKSRSGK